MKSTSYMKSAIKGLGEAINHFIDTNENFKADGYMYDTRQQKEVHILKCIADFANNMKNQIEDMIWCKCGHYTIHKTGYDDSAGYWDEWTCTNDKCYESYFEGSWSDKLSKDEIKKVFMIGIESYFEALERSKSDE